MTAQPETEVVITAAEYDALMDIARAAELARDCRDSDALIDHFDSALDDSAAALERWAAV